MIRIDTGHDDDALLVAALLIAAGILPAPTRPDEQRAFQRLADQLGDGLDRLPARKAPSA
ncbi:hypothetical protein [Thermomonospora amylolytica]|uniref:hypothetical protein n=1 Tax=Thermomonospora amylolytica TaxID=1411117 RepID=UPI000E6B7F01|nr:hypothetical protein [Thermomonospora amylolytica]